MPVRCTIHCGVVAVLGQVFVRDHVRRGIGAAGQNLHARQPRNARARFRPTTTDAADDSPASCDRLAEGAVVVWPCEEAVCGRRRIACYTRGLRRRIVTSPGSQGYNSRLPANRAKRPPSPAARRPDVSRKSQPQQAFAAADRAGGERGRGAGRAGEARAADARRAGQSGRGRGGGRPAGRAGLAADEPRLQPAPPAGGLSGGGAGLPGGLDLLAVFSRFHAHAGLARPRRERDCATQVVGRQRVNFRPC